MLRGFGFQFTGRRDVWQQGQMNVDARIVRGFLSELADRFKKWQALNIANRAANFNQNEIKAFIARSDELLDSIGHMGNDLHGAAQKIPAPFLGDNVLIDAPRGYIVLLVGRPAREALVVTKIEVGFRPIVGHKHLAMLIGAHGARIDIEIGIEFSQANAVTAGLQKSAESR